MVRLDRQSLGDRKEKEALRFLQQRGLELVERNFRSRFGEIDLVMRDEDCLVVVEVRYRRTGGFGGAAASVDRRKRQRLTLAAEFFLRSRAQYAGWPLRFDVIALNGDIGGSGSLQWIADAFRPED